MESNPKTSLLAVVQQLDVTSGVWHDVGQLDDVTEENFDRAARKYLRMYRLSHGRLPRERSRVVKRLVTSTDEPMEW